MSALNGAGAQMCGWYLSGGTGVSRFTAHRCGSVMDVLITPGGMDCQRYRLCTTCSGPDAIGKRRHRDVNAAKNMLTLVTRRALGLPRPDHLVCSWRQQANVGFPPLVRTAHFQTIHSTAEFPF